MSLSDRLLKLHGFLNKTFLGNRGFIFLLKKIFFWLYVQYIVINVEVLLTNSFRFMHNKHFGKVLRRGPAANNIDTVREIHNSGQWVGEKTER